MYNSKDIQVSNSRIIFLLCEKYVEALIKIFIDYLTNTSNLSNRQKVARGLTLATSFENNLTPVRLLSGSSASTPGSSNRMLTINDGEILHSAQSMPNLYAPFDPSRSRASSPLESPSLTRRNRQRSLDQQILQRNTDTPPPRTRNASADFTSPIEGNILENFSVSYTGTRRTSLGNNQDYSNAIITQIKTRIQFTLNSIPSGILERNPGDTEELTKNLLALHQHFFKKNLYHIQPEEIDFLHPSFYPLLVATFPEIIGQQTLDYPAQQSLQEQLRIFSFLSERTLDSIHFSDLKNMCFAAEKQVSTKLQNILNFIEASIVLLLEKNKSNFRSAYAWSNQSFFENVWTVLTRLRSQLLSSMILIPMTIVNWIFLPRQIFRTFEQLKAAKEREFERIQQDLNARRNSATELVPISITLSSQHDQPNKKTDEKLRYIILAITQEIIEHVWYFVGLISHLETHLLSLVALSVYVLHELCTQIVNGLWQLQSPHTIQNSFQSTGLERNFCVITDWWGENDTIQAANDTHRQLGHYLNDLLLFRKQTTISIQATDLGITYLIHPLYIINKIYMIAKAYLSSILALASTGACVLLEPPTLPWSQYTNRKGFLTALIKFCHVTALPILASVRLAAIGLHVASILLKESVITAFNIKEFLKMILIIDCRNFLLSISSEIASLLGQHTAKSTRLSPLDWRYS